MNHTIILTVTWLAVMLPGTGTVMAREYPLMRPDPATKQSWINSYNSAPRAYIDPDIRPKRGSLSLLSHLQYTPSQRDQGFCGNCWAWAGTGCLAIALDVQESVKDRLSIQYVNNCGTEISCCRGGWLVNVTNFYQSVKKAVPWSNSGASWQDEGGSCDSSCAAISTSPNYPISSISYSSVATHGIGQSAAISNLKNVLNQNKAIWFGFFMSTTADWTSFGNFWKNQGESSVWEFDPTCGKAPDQGSGGHAVLCVGYNDDDPRNSYWIMLNSWGTTSGRPNGLFLIAMNMDYDCAEGGGGGDYNHYWQTISATFGAIGPTPTPGPTPDPASGGDTFGSPLDIILNYSSGGSNAGYNNDYEVYDGWIDGETGPDIVYRFTVAGGKKGSLTIDLTGLSGDLDIFLCDGPGVNSVYAYSINPSSSSESINISDALAGTYYLVIDGWWGTVSSYSLNITSSAAEPTPPPAPTPIPGPTTVPGTVSFPGDYNGDGYDDIAIFRPSSGLWAIRSVTRLYFGKFGDVPVPGDYTGDGLTDIGIFRGASGLWVIRGVTRLYFGTAGDIPVPTDYDGDGTFDIGIYRNGLWAVRGVTRAYFGSSGDLPVTR